MARGNILRQNFLGGEFSPRVWGRTDLPQYANAYELLKDTITQPQGGSSRRPGFKFVKRTEGNLPARIVPFIFSATQSYIIEFQPDPASTDGTPKIKIIDANNPALTYNIIYFKVGYTSKDGGGPTPPTNPGPVWTYAELDEMQFAQSGDILWLVQENHKPFNIIRRVNAAGTGFEFIGKDFHALAFGNSPVAADRDFPSSEAWRVPYLLPNTSPITIAPLGADALIGDRNIQLQASEKYFTDDMKDTIVKITQTVSVAGVAHRYTGSAVITLVVPDPGETKAVFASAYVLDPFKNNTADADWELSAWTPRTGYPRTVGLYEGRVYYYGSKSRPDHTWASQAGNYLRMDARGFSRLQDPTASKPEFPDITNATAYDFDPVGGQVNSSAWLSPGKTLAMGSLGQEFVAQGPDQTLSMGILNIRAVPETAHGSAYVQAVRVAYAVDFITRSGKGMRELAFDFNSDSYQATNVAILADHLLKGGIKQIVWQEDPNGVLWARDKGGALMGLTRERQLNVASWHRHQIGGRLDLAGLGVYGAPAVTSIAVTPIADGQDRLWAVIQRTIGGVDTFSLESMAKEFPENRTTITLEECCYMDSHKVVDLTVTPGTELTGLMHLAGEEVQVVVAYQGASSPTYEGKKTVSPTGTITLTHTAVKAIVGLPYTTKIRSLNTEGASVLGSSQGLMKRTDKLYVKLSNSYGLRYGSKDSNMRPVNFGDPNRPGHVELFTGSKSLEFPNGWDTESPVWFETDFPFPCTINSFACRSFVNEV